MVNGFYRATESQKINKIGQLRYGVSKVIEDEVFSPSLSQKHTVADLVTGYGVAESVKHYYAIWGGQLKGKKAIIQGWGNVASAAGFYLAKMGVKLVGIIDQAGGLIDEHGLSFEKVRELFLTKDKNTLRDTSLIPFNEANEKIWKIHAELFIPAAASRIVRQEQIASLIKNGLELISCGANVPFEDKEIFYGPTAEWVDQQIALIPDFIANCGMARVFAYLMQDNVEMTDQAIFQDISDTIKTALLKIYSKEKTKNKLYQHGLTIALKQLM